MKQQKKKIHISKQELVKADPNLLPPTQNIEENLAEGRDDLLPDPDNVPGGFDSTLNQQISPRPDLEQADAEAVLESTEGKAKKKHDKK